MNATSGKEITNADFEQAVEAVLPKSLWFENRKSLDWFFDGWVNGTAFPRFEIKDARFAARTGKPMVSATLLQTRCARRSRHQRSTVRSGRGQQGLSGPGICRGTRDALHSACAANVKRLILDPYQTVLTAP